MQILSTFAGGICGLWQMLTVYLFVIFMITCISDRDLLELVVYLKYLTIRINCGII